MKTKVSSLRPLFLVLTLMITASSCAWTQDSIPEAPIRFAESDYTLGGQVTAEECRTYIFGIAWSAIFGRDTTWTGGYGIFDLLLSSGVTPEAEEAMFTALESEANATHLVAPRVRNTFAGLGTVGMPLFGKRCGTVWARTAEVGEPLPRTGGTGRSTNTGASTAPAPPASTTQPPSNPDVSPSIQ